MPKLLEALGFRLAPSATESRIHDRMNRMDLLQSILQQSPRGLCKARRALGSAWCEEDGKGEADGALFSLPLAKSLDVPEGLVGGGFEALVSRLGADDGSAWVQPQVLGSNGIPGLCPDIAVHAR